MKIKKNYHYRTIKRVYYISANDDKNRGKLLNKPCGLYISGRTTVLNADEDDGTTREDNDTALGSDGLTLT